MLDTRCWMLDTGYWILDAGCGELLPGLKILDLLDHFSSFWAFDL